MVNEEFNKLYQDTKLVIRNISIKYHKRSGVPVDEFISQLNEELWLAYRDYDEEKNTQMTTWVNSCLTKRAIDVIRWKEGHYRRRVTFLHTDTNSDDNGDATTFDVTSEIYTEDVVGVKIARADQRQLIDSLKRSVKTDATMTSIIEAYSNAPASASRKEIAKSLNLHHEFVNRKLRKLGRQFDSSRFGDIRDIIAV